MDLVTQARQARERLDQTLNDAFGFLVDEHNYKSLPLEKGGGPYHLFTKRYHLGGRCIGFFCDHDHQNIYDLYLQPVDLFSRSDLHPELRYADRWHLSLEAILAIKGVEVTIPRFESITEAASFFAEHLKSNLADEIAGDFSAFPEMLFTVEIVNATGNRRIKIGEYDDVAGAERSALRELADMSLSRHDYVEIVGKFSQ